MIRYLIWSLGGLCLGAIIHLVVILITPAFAERNVWAKISELGPVEQIIPIPSPVAGGPNTFDLDPALIYAACRLNIADGPGAVEGTLPATFWSVAVFEPGGTIVYSTTNRAATGNALNLGIFNPAQTRLLAEQQLEIEEGLLIVESSADDIFVLIRLWPEYPVLAPRYREALSALSCRVIR